MSGARPGEAGLDWANLGFSYVRTPYRFQATWADGRWTPGELLEDNTLVIEEGACALHYGQQCFEGLKAFATADGQVLLFRPDQNAARLARSAARLMMPAVPPELFMHAVRECVRANLAWVPPHASGASLYIRPVLLGVGDNLGLRPAPRYLFRVFCSPVGPYFKGGLKGIKLLASDHDRAAPRGTGAHKAGGNYAGGLLASHEAKQKGYDEALYLDPVHRRYLDEAGSANLFGILEAIGDHPPELITPESGTILPSITLDSLMTVAREELGLSVARRKIPVDELMRLTELACAGTAAVVTPVASVTVGERTFEFLPAPGPWTRKLYDLLRSLQRGEREDPYDWTVNVA